jgi:quercetin dioxygenase-like cupin family protein
MTVRNHVEQLVEHGYAGPLRVLSRSECRRFLRAVGGAGRHPPLDWEKGCAATSRPFYEIAMHPAIMEIVSAVLGENVMLWGASIQDRRPRAVHPWHTDIESAQAGGATVSVWIGLEHTSRASSLLLASHSHRFGASVQEVRARAGVRREDVGMHDIARWAREHHPPGAVVEPELGDGEALVFDGRLWHGSRNRSRKQRRALLLQYAAPATAIRIPDLNQLDWPFRMIDRPRPPCIMLRGDDTAGVNRMVPPPAAPVTAADPRLTSRIYPLRLPLPGDKRRSWVPVPIFRGATANVGSLSCHVSRLKRGSIPHRPHVHEEEELLLMMAGEADLLLPGAARKPDRRRRLKAGEFVYYPRGFRHSLQAAECDAANYLMFKWRSRAGTPGVPLPHGHYRFRHDRTAMEPGFQAHVLFEGPTRWLRKLHCHASTLAPGAGYDAHVDAHDVAIVVLQGEVETLGQRIGPHGVVFYAAGEPHGMRNPGDGVARYVVFEFHG